MLKIILGMVLGGMITMALEALAVWFIIIRRNR